MGIGVVEVGVGVKVRVVGIGVVEVGVGVK